jgi:hypothetical protein
MDNETVSYRQETVAPAKRFVNREASLTRLIAGVGVPDGPLITAVIEHARRLSEPYLFNHAMRSWLFAETIGRIKGIDYDREVVAIGTILHDIGLTASVSGPNRFEVNGADAALSFIKDKGLSDRRAQLIWDMVALNSTPSLALHKEPEVAVGTMGIGLDYGGFGVEALPHSRCRAHPQRFPPTEDEATICRDMLSTRRGEAGDEPRQLPARLRRAIRAWLQSCINGRPIDERSVR